MIYILRIITVLEWNPEEDQLQYETNLKTAQWEQLFGAYHLRNNVWIHKIFQIFPYALNHAWNFRAKLYEKLLLSQGKPLSLLTMDLRQKPYRYEVLLKVTDAHKGHPGENQIDYCLVDCLSKYLKRRLKIIFSKALAKKDNKETDRKLLVNLLLPFYTNKNYICLLLEKTFIFQTVFNKISSGSNIEDVHNSVKQTDISPCPWALFGSNALMNLIICLVLNSMWRAHVQFRRVNL